MKTWKKIVAIGMGTALLLGGIAGCTTTYSKDYVDQAVDAAVVKANNEKQVEIDALNDQIGEQLSKNNNNALEIQELRNKIIELEKEPEPEPAPEPILPDVTGEVILPEPTGEVIDEIEFGQVVQESLDDSDLELFDGKIPFDDDDYDAHEEINIDFLLAFNGFGFEEDFFGSPYFIFESGDLEYKYIFDDEVTLSDISEDEPVDISFLGKILSIIEADSSSITVKSGDEHFLSEGGTVDIDGKVLTLLLVGDDEVMVSYNEESSTIDEGETEEIGGLDVRADEVLNNYRGGVATLVTGLDVIKTIDDGDEWIEDDERFLFGMSTGGGELSSLSIYWDLTSDELDDDYPPLGAGDSVSFPDDFAKVTFTGLDDVNYEECDVYFDDIDAKDDLATDEEAVIVKCKAGLIEIDSEDDLEKMFIISNGDYYYYDDEKDIVQATSNAAKVVNDDLELEVLFSGSKLKFKDSANKKIRFDTDVTNLRFGAEEEEAEKTDVKYAGNEFGKLDGDLLTQTGVIVKNVESNADNDEATLVIPDAQVLANLEITLV